MRAFGRIRHPGGLRGEAELIGHIYQRYGDPSGIRRHRGQTRVTDQFHYMQTLPGEPILAHSNVWTFTNAYDVNTTNVWDEGSSGTGTVLTIQDSAGGFAKVTNAITDDSYYYYQSKYEVAKLLANKGLWLLTRVNLWTNGGQADVFVGLCARLASGNLFDNRVDSLGFYTADGSNVLYMEGSKDSTPTQTSTAIAINDNAEMVLGIRVISTTSALFYIAGDYVGQVTTNLPDDEEMTFSFGIRNGEAGYAKTLTIGKTILLQDI